MEKRDCIKVGFTLKVFDPTRVSVSSRNICAHTVHGTYKVEYGTERSFTGQRRVIIWSSRERTAGGKALDGKSFPLSPNPFPAPRARANIISVFIETATIAVPGDNARQLVSGLQQRDPYIFRAVRRGITYILALTL